MSAESLATSMSHPHSPVRVQVVFHVSSEEQAQAVAAKMVDRAHEIANLPECECDLDVSIQRTGAEGASLLDPSSTPAPEHPAKL